MPSYRASIDLREEHRRCDSPSKEGEKEKQQTCRLPRIMRQHSWLKYLHLPWDDPFDGSLAKIGT